MLNAIDHADADNVYGPDAERLERLRGELHGYLRRDTGSPVSDAEVLDRADVVAFARAELLAAGHGGEVRAGATR